MYGVVAREGNELKVAHYLLRTQRSTVKGVCYLEQLACSLPDFVKMFFFNLTHVNSGCLVCVIVSILDTVCLDTFVGV